MPAAVVGLALVGGGAITAATLGYVALGVTVAGMVTKNKTLMKIGGQLGLAAGVAGIATSFMGAGTEAVTSGMSSTAQDSATLAGMDLTSAPGADASILADAARLDSINPARPENILNDTYGSEGASFNTPGASPPDTSSYTNQTITSDINATPTPTTTPTQPQAPVAPENRVIDLTNKLGRQGAGVGDLSSPSDDLYNKYNPQSPDGFTKPDGISSGSQVAKPNRGFLESIFGSDTGKPLTEQEARLASDRNKYMMMEGGKIIAGGVQGLSATSNMNAQLAENRRVDDIRRANAGSIGRSNYGLMRG